MRRIVAITGMALALGSIGAAWAAVDFGKEREAAMKTVGGSMKVSANFVQGKKPFDAATAKASMEKVAAAATAFPTYFPAGSEKADKLAAPAIWTSKADFEARAAKLATDATAAAAAADGGANSFKVAFATVASNCRGCHQTYRLKD